MASIFAQQLGASQNKSVETKDAKGNGSSRETYFTVPKNVKGEDYSFLKLQEGLNLIDILPYTAKGGILPTMEAGKFDYKLDVNVYKNIGTSGSDLLSLASLNMPDPLANELSNLYTAQKAIGSQEDKDKFYNEKIKPLRSKRRCAYVVLHNIDGKRVPKLFETAHFSFERLIAEKLEEEKALGLPPRIFADPLTGCSIAIMGKKDTFGGHEFIKISSVAFVDRKTPIAKTEEAAIKLVNGLPKLDSLLVVKTYEQASDMYFGKVAQAPVAVAEEEEKLSFDTPAEMPAPLDEAPVTVVTTEVAPEPTEAEEFDEEDLVF